MRFLLRRTRPRDSLIAVDLTAILLAAIFTIASCSQAPAKPGPEVTITLDASKRYQTIDGFGTCLAWWVGDPYEKPAFQRLYYQTLGASMLRMEMHPYALTSNDKLDGEPVVLSDDLAANIKLFKFDAAGVKNYGQMAAASKTLALDDFKLIGTIWSPPHWMKYGAKINESGQTCGGALKTDPYNLQQFGRYVASFVKGFERAYGVPMYAVSIQNEPAFGHGFNSCVYTPDTYALALKAIGDEFARQKITAKLFGPEDVGVGKPKDKGPLDRQMSFIDAVRKNPDAAKHLSIYAIHGYAGDGASDAGSAPENWSRYWKLIKDDAKPAWQTEASGQDTKWITVEKGPQWGGLALGQTIHEALVYGNQSAWLYWLIANEKDEGDTQKQTLTTSKGDPKSPKFCAAQHFFRFIRPGAVRIDASPDHPVFNVSAFLHEKQKSLTIVLVHNDTVPRTAHIKVPEQFRDAKFEVYRTSEKESFDPFPAIAPSEGILTIPVPAQSMITLYARPEPEK